MATITEKEIALNRLEVKFITIKNGGIVLDTNSYKSTIESENYVSGIIVNYLTGKNTGDFNYRNLSGAKVTLTEEELKTLLYTMQQLYVLSFDRNDELIEAINLSSDPLSIDLDSGWPTVPYELPV